MSMAIKMKGVGVRIYRPIKYITKKLMNILNKEDYQRIVL
jgi:hypothetical protein